MRTSTKENGMDIIWCLGVDRKYGNLIADRGNFSMTYICFYMSFVCFLQWSIWHSKTQATRFCVPLTFSTSLCSGCVRVTAISLFLDCLPEESRIWSSSATLSNKWHTSGTEQNWKDVNCYAIPVKIHISAYKVVAYLSNTAVWSHGALQKLSPVQ